MSMGASRWSAPLKITLFIQVSIMDLLPGPVVMSHILSFHLGKKWAGTVPKLNATPYRGQKGPKLNK